MEDITLQPQSFSDELIDLANAWFKLFTILTCGPTPEVLPAPIKTPEPAVIPRPQEDDPFNVPAPLIDPTPKGFSFF